MSNTEETANPPVGNLNENPPINAEDANAGQAPQINHYNKLQEENARLRADMEGISTRLDTITTMLNALMMQQAQQASAPNNSRLPPAHGHIAPIPPTQGAGVAAASAVQDVANAPPPALQTIAIQPPNQYSTHASFPATGLTPYPGANTGLPLYAAPALALMVPPPATQPTFNLHAQLPAAQPTQHDRGHHSGQAGRGERLSPAAPRNDDNGGNANSSHLQPALQHGCDRLFWNAPLHQARHPESEAEDDPNNDYAFNRERPETNCRSLNIEQFSSEDKTQDFTIWIEQFEQAVNRGMNPHSQERHHRHCLQWLPNYLNADAYIIWNRCVNRKDWIKLKKELTIAFDDPIIRAEWKNNPQVYMWDEHMEPLNLYCSKVKRYVDTYDDDIAGAPEAVRNQYYFRFVAGLPGDYQDRVKMGTSFRKQSVDRALDICIRFQSLKKSKEGKKLEVDD